MIYKHFITGSDTHSGRNRINDLQQNNMKIKDKKMIYISPRALTSLETLTFAC